MIWAVAADAADVRVVTRKTWTTWKQKCALCVKSSTWAVDGAPARLARTESTSVSNVLLFLLDFSLGDIQRQMIGTNDMRRTRAADGSSPAITPFSDEGSLSMKPRKGRRLVR